MSTPVVITAPASKSLSHRAIIAACLATGTSRLSGLLESDDTKRTMAIMQDCGAHITRHDNGDYTIIGVNGTIAPDKRIDCFVGESGTTCRLLAAVLAAGKGSFFFHGEGRMHDRPMGELLDVLALCGVELDFEQKHNFLPFTMHTQGLQTKGPHTKELNNAPANDGLFIPVNESSQYLSGMILAAPMSEEGLTLMFDGAHAVSKSYVLLTLQALLQHRVAFSLEVLLPETGQWLSAQEALKKTHSSAPATQGHMDDNAGNCGCPNPTGTERSEPLQACPEILAHQPAHNAAGGTPSPCDLATLAAIKASPLWQRHIRLTIAPSAYEPLQAHTEGDYSGASYLLAAGALGQRAVTVQGLNPQSLQGDSAILTILERMGANVEWVERDGVSAVTISPAPLRGIDIDMGDCPDLVPTVAILAARASSPTTIRNVSHLTLKESNRLLAPAQELAKVGCTITVSPDSMIIYPLEEITNQTPCLSSHGDHRMAMSLALLELGDDITVHLDNEHCVSKSYPQFWEDWHLLRPQSNLGKNHG